MIHSVTAFPQVRAGADGRMSHVKTAPSGALTPCARGLADAKKERRLMDIILPRTADSEGGF